MYYILMTNVAIITVNELKTFAPEINLTQYDDPTISGYILQASQIVSDYIDYTPMAEYVVDEIAQGRISTRGDLVIFPQKVPIQSVQSIQIVRGGTSIDVGLTDGNNNTRYNIDWQKRKILYPHEEVTLSGAVVFIDFWQLKQTTFYTKISYRGGFEVSELPLSIKQATILVLRDLFSKQYNRAGASEISQGGISLRFNMSKDSTSFMKQAKDLLNPYIR